MKRVSAILTTVILALFGLGILANAAAAGATIPGQPAPARPQKLRDIEPYVTPVVLAAATLANEKTTNAAPDQLPFIPSRIEPNTAAVRSFDLPGGGQAALVFSATAGDVMISICLVFIAAILLFSAMRSVVKR